MTNNVYKPKPLTIWDQPDKVADMFLSAVAWGTTFVVGLLGVGVWSLY